MAKNTDSKIVHALWIGGSLGPIEALCLTSFLRHGYQVRLHRYESLQNVPPGVVECDASLVLPKSAVFRHQPTGSYAMFANAFRYELLAVEDGVYVDCDVFCLKPLPLSDYVFGYESPGRINNAVLDMPPESPLSEDLRSLRFKADQYWPWESSRIASWRQRRAAKKAGANPLSYRTWGIYGPEALSYLVKKHGLETLAQPKDVFYPVHHEEVAKLFDPAFQLDDLITPNTIAIHLYNESIKSHRLDVQSAPLNSPIGKLLQDYELR